MCYHFFKTVSHFVVLLGKYDFSFATEYCLISHTSLDKSLDRGKTSSKNMLIFLLLLFINILFRLPRRAVYTRQGLIFALVFLLRNVTSNFIKLLRTRTCICISQRQLVPKRQNWDD